MVDRISDNNREQAKKVEKKRLDAQNQRLKEEAGKDFKAQYQSMLEARVNEQDKMQRRKDVFQRAEGEKKEKEGAEILKKIVKATKYHEQSRRQEGKAVQKEVTNKKEDKKEEVVKQDRGDSRGKTVSEEGHLKVAARDSSQQQGKNSQDSEGEGQRQGSSSGGGGQGQSSGGQSGSSSSSAGQQGQSSHQNSQGDHRGQQAAVISNQRIEKIDLSSQQGGGSQNQGFSRESLDEIVKSVKLIVRPQGETEMEIHLSDEYFQGLKLKARQSPEGVILTFICPNSEVRKIFLLNRFQIYTRLMEEKGLSIYKIDVI